MDSSPHHPSVSEDNITSSPESIPEAKGTPVPSPFSPSALPKVNPNELPQYVQLQWNCPFEPTCAQTFDSKAAINAHLLSVHTCFPFRCLIPRCTASFMNKQEIKTHLKSSHPNATHFTCISCLKIYSSYARLRAHYSAFHASGLLRCSHPNCTHLSTTRMQFYMHYRHHKSTHSVICTICNKTLKQPYLRDHLRTHTENRQTYQCTTCKVSFSAKRYLRVHTRLGCGTKPYPCSGCTKSFTQLNHLKRHEETHLQPTEQCPECPRRFGGRYTLMGHLLYHRQKMKKDKEQAAPSGDTA